MSASILDVLKDLQTPDTRGIDQIERALTALGVAWSPHEGYSGRGMNGRVCAYAVETDVDVAVELRPFGLRNDRMGQGWIYYTGGSPPKALPPERIGPTGIPLPTCAYCGGDVEEDADAVETRRGWYCSECRERAL